MIYANDNSGKWKSDFKSLITHCYRSDSSGAQIVGLLKPDEADYLVLKPKHSAFFATPLDTLLKYLGVETLIICGIGGNLCVLFTANDAYMRDFHLFVPQDCIATETKRGHQFALHHLKNRARSRNHALEKRQRLI